MDGGWREGGLTEACDGMWMQRGDDHDCDGSRGGKGGGEFSKLKIRQWEVQWYGVDSDGEYM